MSNVKLVRETLKGVIVHDVENDRFTAFIDCKIGGPIVSASTAEEAKEKLMEAVKVASAFMNLRTYERAVTKKDRFIPSNDDKPNESLNLPQFEVVFREAEFAA